MHFTPAIVAGLAVCLVVGIIPAIRILLAQRPRPHEQAEAERPRGPYLRPGPGEPAWWPQFEREFAGYVALRDEGRSAAGPEGPRPGAPPPPG
jgi:hypothetical protein